MALSKALEELLKEYTPEDQAAIRAVWEASPALQAKMETQAKAQSDYSRTIQEAQKLKKDAELEAARAKKLYESNTEWFRTNTAELDRLETENADFKTKVTELEKARSAAGGSGAPAADMAKYDELISTINKKLAATEQALKDSQTEVAKRFDAGGMWIFEVENQAEAYRQEFGKPLDRVAFTKFMNEQSIMDPKKAMEMFSSEDRQAKLLQTQEVELRKKWDAEQSSKQVPYANGTGVMTDKGPLQYYMERPATGPQSTKEGAVAAAAELAAEGKG